VNASVGVYRSQRNSRLITTIETVLITLIECFSSLLGTVWDAGLPRTEITHTCWIYDGVALGNTAWMKVA